MNLVVLDADTLGFPDEAWEGVAALGRLVRHGSTPYDPDIIAERCADAEIVLTNKVPFSAQTLKRLPRLKLICILATGYNIIDLPAAQAAGVTVCNVPAYSTRSVIQHTLALMLEALNHAGLHNASVHAGEWVRSPLFAYWKQAPVELAGRTVGIIGYGEIGSGVGEVVHALGAQVLGHSPSRSRKPAWMPFEWAGPEAIFERADVVSLHCPQTPENAGFVNAGLLGRMRPGSVLINTARGGLINETDLAAALREGPLAAAAVDVLSREPMDPQCPLLGLENCIITPHIAWASEPARRRLLAVTAANIRAFQSGEPRNVIN